MKNLVALCISLSVMTGAAHADYGGCKTAIESHAFLIAPPIAIADVTKVADKIFVVLVPGGGILPYSVIPVHAEYAPEVFEALSTSTGPWWLGLTDETYRGGDAMLWTHLWVNTPTGCVDGRIGDRVFSGQTNAPHAFAHIIETWEEDNPPMTSSSSPGSAP